MFGQGGKLSLKAVDEEIIKSMESVISVAEEFASELPLVGINVQAMHDIEAKGLELCRARLIEIKAEIDRLSTEARNTEAIVTASVAKLASLKSFITPAPTAQKVPPMVHSDIRDNNAGPSPVVGALGEAQTLELDDAERGAVEGLR